MVTVKFITCDGNRNERSTNLRQKPGETELELIARAANKIWGGSCYWWQDSGLEIGFGQIMRPVSNNSRTSVTYRLRADVTGMTDNA